MALLQLIATATLFLASKSGEPYALNLNNVLRASYWVYHKLEDTSTMKESSEEERKWCKLVYIFYWIKLHCSVLYIGWAEAGKQPESKNRNN